MTTYLPTVISSINAVFFIKIILLIFTAMFIIFMFVLLTQINSMDDIITQDNSSSLLKLLAILQIIAGLGIFIYAAFVL